MKLVYSRRALADLIEIANYYSSNASPMWPDPSKSDLSRPSRESA